MSGRPVLTLGPPPKDEMPDSWVCTCAGPGPGECGGCRKVREHREAMVTWSVRATVIEVLVEAGLVDVDLAPSSPEEPR